MEDKGISISVLDAPMGTGKALSLDSHLYTENGVIKMGDVKIGMKIFGEDGILHTVVGVYPQGKKDCYRMTFSDGTEVISSSDHIWTVQTPYDISVGKYKDLTTKQLAEKELYQQTKNFKNWKFWVPLTSPLQLPNREVTFDPYVLGLLLGDGGISCSVIFSNVEEDIRKLVENYCDSIGDKFKEEAIDCRITGGNTIHQLRKYGLYGSRSWEKFIPNDFKINDFNVRINLLRGLIDSDGFCYGSGYEFTTTSKQLSEDVEWLVRSLGGYCSTIEREVGYKDKDGNKVICKNSFRSYIKAPLGIKFHSSVKHDLKYKKPKTNPRRSIRGIEFIGQVECQCISVDNPSQLFLTNGLIPTHNTQAIIKWMNSNPNRKYLYVSPMLSEVESRIPTECAGLEFVYPTMKYNSETGTASKGYSLLCYLREGKNISFTHALFKEMTPEHTKVIKEEGYTLIIDEEIPFIDPYDGYYKRDDIISLETKECLYVDENNLGRVIWTWDDMLPNTAYSELRRMCQMGHLYCAKGERKMLVTHLPISLLECTKENILITYLFNGSVMKSFLDIHGVKIHNFLDTHKDVGFSYCHTQFLERARELITLADSPSTRNIKRMKYSLSSHWFQQKASRSELQSIGSAVRSLVQKHGRSNVVLTTKKSAIDRKGIDGKTNQRCILPKGFSVDDIFLHSGARAINEYGNRNVGIHAYNRYVHLSTKAYLQDYGTPPEDDDFALSEMVQWLWRTSIRNDNPVTFYILSERMEQIFKTWLYEDS